MFTPGRSHSEVEILEILDHLQPQDTGIELRYTRPFAKACCKYADGAGETIFLNRIA
jgi:hypothetical protein